MKPHYVPISFDNLPKWIKELVKEGRLRRVGEYHGFVVCYFSNTREWICNRSDQWFVKQ